MWKEYCADQFGFKTERKRKKVYESKGEWKWKAAVDEWLIGEGRDERWNLSIQNRAYGAYETQYWPGIPLALDRILPVDLKKLLQQVKAERGHQAIPTFREAVDWLPDLNHRQPTKTAIGVAEEAIQKVVSLVNY